MFDISSNSKQFQRSLSDAAQNQFPFALALTINDTLADVKLNREKDLERKLDNPTPFTRRGMYMVRATKRKLSGEVGFKNIQAKYLLLNVTGGTRIPRSRAILVPRAIRLNKYGNMPKGSVGRNLARSDTFVASKNNPRTKHLAPGIYKRGKKRRGKAAAGPTMLVSFEDKARYKKRYDFQRPAHKTASGVFPRHMARNLKKAMASRR